MSGLRVVVAPHPAVYIAELLILAAFAITASLEFMLYMLLAVVLARLLCGNAMLAITALSRLKWFFLAIALLAWLTAPDFPQGWHYPLRSIMVLMLLVLAADCFHQRCNNGEKLAALLWWLRPLQYAGVPVERFVARLWLTIQLLPQQQQLLVQALKKDNKLAGLRELFKDTAPAERILLADGSEIKAGSTIDLPRMGMSPLHWCRPILLLLLLWQLGTHIN